MLPSERRRNSILPSFLVDVMIGSRAKPEAQHPSTRARSQSGPMIIEGVCLGLAFLDACIFRTREHGRAKQDRFVRIAAGRQMKDSNGRHHKCSACILLCEERGGNGARDTSNPNMFGMECGDGRRLISRSIDEESDLPPPLTHTRSDRRHANVQTSQDAGKAAGKEEQFHHPRRHQSSKSSRSITTPQSPSNAPTTRPWAWK